MAKTPTLSDIVNISTSAPTLNLNWDAIQTAFENTLSLDGSTPNSMQADIDLNGNDILNVDNVHADTLVLGGKVVSTTLTTFPTAIQDFAGISLLTYSAVEVGDFITVAEVGEVYEVLAADAVPADLDYTGSGGVRLSVVITGDTNFRAFGSGVGALNSAISAVSLAGGGTVVCSEDLSATEAIIGKDNVTLVFNNCTITADAVYNYMIDFGGSDGFHVEGTALLACGGNVLDAIRGDGTKNGYISGGLTVTGWKEGVVFFSTPTSAVENIVVDDGFTLGVPHTSNVVYPVLFSARPSIAGLTGKNIWIGAIKIEDTVAGEYSSSNQRGVRVTAWSI